MIQPEDETMNEAVRQLARAAAWFGASVLLLTAALIALLVIVVLRAIGAW